MNLRALPGGLTLSTLERSTVEELDEAIKKVGFHATKAASLKRLAVKLREEFGGEVPSELKDLLSIHGVGPKMAFLYLQSIGQNVRSSFPPSASSSVELTLL
jgi:endonuclease-3